MQPEDAHLGSLGQVDPPSLRFVRAPAGLQVGFASVFRKIKKDHVRESPQDGARHTFWLWTSVIRLSAEVSIRPCLKHAGFPMHVPMCVIPLAMLSRTCVYLMYSVRLSPSSFFLSSSPNKSWLMNSGQVQWLSTEKLSPLPDCIRQSGWPTQVVPAWGGWQGWTAHASWILKQPRPLNWKRVQGGTELKTSPNLSCYWWGRKEARGGKGGARRGQKEQKHT